MCFVPAEKVTKELTELAKQAAPKSVVPQKGVREALGVSHQPSTDVKPGEQEADSTSQSQPSSETTDQSQAATQPQIVSSQSESGIQAVKEEEVEMEGVVEEGKESSVGKDSMDQDLDAVLDELEMAGEGSEGGEGGEDEIAEGDVVPVE